MAPNIFYLETEKISHSKCCMYKTYKPEICLLTITIIITIPLPLSLSYPPTADFSGTFVLHFKWINEIIALVAQHYIFQTQKLHVCMLWDIIYNISLNGLVSAINTKHAMFTCLFSSNYKLVFIIAPFHLCIYHWTTALGNCIKVCYNKCSNYVSTISIRKVAS